MGEMKTRLLLTSLFIGTTHLEWAQFVTEHYKPATLNTCVSPGSVGTFSLLETYVKCTESPQCAGVSVNPDEGTFSECVTIGVPEQTGPPGQILHRVSNVSEISRYRDTLVDDVPDSHITATSAYADNQPHRGRLNTIASGALMGTWFPVSKLTVTEYIQVMFQTIKEIVAVATQGRNGFTIPQYVTSYEVSYSVDCTTFSFVKGLDNATMLFPGNNDTDTIVWNDLPNSALALCVRVQPITFEDHPCMRFGLKGANLYRSYCMPDIVESVPDSHITASSLLAINTPERGRLHTMESGGRRGSWCSATLLEDDEFIQVRFPAIKSVVAVATQGRNNYSPPQYVTSYKVSYSVDCVTFSYVEGPDNAPMEFSGNNDSDTIVRNALPETILALCITVYPVTFQQHPSMRFGIEGCGLYRTSCIQDIVVNVPDNHITASSALSPNNEHRGRLHTQAGGLRGAWCAGSRLTVPESIQVRFHTVKEIVGVATQGRNGFTLKLQYVTSYKVSYSGDCATFSFVKGPDNTTMVFPGNADLDTIVSHDIPESFLAACVRVHPQTFNDYPCMRFGIMGINRYCL